MKTNSNAARNVARRARRARMFPASAVCALCGYANPVALIAVDKTLLEEHHVFGAAFDDGTRIPLCRNCHAEVTEGIRATGASMRPQPSLFENLIQATKALEVYYRAQAITHGRIAHELQRRVDTLDALFPDWRSIEEEL
ncbi:MAG: hypothetical protein ACJ8AK_03640 [Gemmatimonadaceae bacterium]